jgi:hypothetical protein
MALSLSTELARTVAVAAAALLLACGGSDEPASIDVREATSDTGTSEASSAGARSGEQGATELAADFPSDVPMYSPSTTREVLAGAGKHATSFTTEASSQEVAAFYRQQLQDNGWKLEKEAEFGDHVVLRGLKQGRKVSVFIMTREGLTTVAVTVARG